MPTRLLREGILDSDRINRLDWPAEVFYRRLMSKVDDHGLYDARLSMLRASLYPIGTDRVREADISRWMAACQKAGLILLYEADGKPYLRMIDTRWEVRSKPKYPLPPENICEQAEACACLVVDVVGDVFEGEGEPDKRAKSTRKKPLPPDFAISDRVRAWAAKKGFSRLEEHLESFVSKCKAKGYTYADWDEGFMGAIRDDWARLGNTTPAAVKVDR